MSDQNLSEEIINSESITENESIENQDQNSLDDQESPENETNNEVEDDLENKTQEENKIKEEEEKKDNEEKIEKKDNKIEDLKIKEDKEVKETDNKEDNKTVNKEDDKTVNKEDNKEIKEDDTNNDNDKEENKEDKLEENKEDKIKEKENNSKDEAKNKEKSKNDEELNKSESNKESETDSQKNDNKKSDKDDNNSFNKKGGNNSNNYRDKGYNGRFMPRGYQHYNHHPYDDWGRRRGMNYPPYYEKDRRYGMRGDFRGRDYRDYNDMRMERDYRGGFRDRDRDFDYPKFYGRGRDQRFFKRDRDIKYKRDYYDDYNMRNMDKDMRMNNMMRECRVYVQNLSYEVNSEMLKRFMEKVGKVVSSEILTTPDGRSKGCAVVQFETPNEARRAISDLQDNQFQGRPIHIREDREGLQYNNPMMDKGYMNDKQMGYQNEGGPSNYQNNINNTPKEQRIFVGNLDVNVTANDLRTLFEPAGTINYADVFQKDRNQPSKHGIIGFQDSSSIKKAIEMFNGITYRNRKLEVHEDRRGIVPIRRFNSYKSDKNMTIHNANHHPYQPNTKPYPNRGGKGNGSFPGKFNNNRQPLPHHQSMQNPQPQKMQQPPLPPHPSNTNQDKSNGNAYGKGQPYNQQQNNSITYPHQQSVQPNSQVAMQYSQPTTQAPYMQPMTATYAQSSQSTYAQSQGVQQAASVQLYAGYPMTDQTATNSSVAAYPSSYQTAAYYSSLSHQAQPVALPAGQPVQQPYPVATNVDYNNLYSAYYGQASQVGVSGYPMMTQSTTTATAQGQAGYTEGTTMPTTYNYY